MRLVLLSDTHLMHLRHNIVVPDGDVLVHAGDATFKGTSSEIELFGEWFGALPHKHKLFVPGNHDCLFEQADALARIHLYGCRGEQRDIVLLRDSGVEIDGVKFWGSPWQPEFMGWAFNLPRGNALADKWALIPDDTDVLITHGPPHKIGDWVPRAGPVGCEALLDRVLRLKPKVHVFGHIHGGYGEYRFHDMHFVNASICNEAYVPMNAPIVVDL